MGTIQTRIKNRWKYQEIIERIGRIEGMIQDKGGFLKAPKDLVSAHQYLAEMTLEYEIQNDMIKALL